MKEYKSLLSLCVCVQKHYIYQLCQLLQVFTRLQGFHNFVYMTWLHVLQYYLYFHFLRKGISISDPLSAYLWEYPLVLKCVVCLGLHLGWYIKNSGWDPKKNLELQSFQKTLSVDYENNLLDYEDQLLIDSHGEWYVHFVDLEKSIFSSVFKELFCLLIDKSI